MREPTKEEMVAGIAEGFRRFLAGADPYGTLNTVGISKAIQAGVREAMERACKEERRKSDGSQQRRPPDVTITVTGKYGIKWKHALEAELGKVLIPMGFSRTGSGVNGGGDFEIYFRQFGVCGPEAEGE